MKRVSYALAFSLAITGLSGGGVMAFRRLEADAEAARAASAALAAAPVERPRSGAFVPIAHEASEYAKYAAEDARWRARHARAYTLRELRERGDGTRSPRQLMQDRVYEYQRRGQDARAVAELERWIARNPGDQQTLLELARLLNETGRNADAVVRYRQLLVLKQRNAEE